MIQKIKIIILLFGLTLVACEKSGDSDSTEQNREFVLYFGTTVDLNGSETTTVFFATTDTTEFPTVIVNDSLIEEYGSGSYLSIQPIPTEYLEKFDFLGENIDYGYCDIPTELKFSFSIICNGQTSSGEILKPERPNNIKCNNQDLREKTLDVQIDTVESSNNYLFTWQCNNYNYFSIDLLASSEDETFKVEDSQYTLEDLGFSMIRIEVTSNTGFDIYGESIDSNFELEYGKGFVLSSNTANLNYVKINR